MVPSASISLQRGAVHVLAAQAARYECPTRSQLCSDSPGSPTKPGGLQVPVGGFPPAAGSVCALVEGGLQVLLLFGFTVSLLCSGC